ncbi:MAG: hypothetical protein WC791_00220 [Candidatus Paceibacterota bacterium]|jgi:hypothetical protein
MKSTLYFVLILSLLLLINCKASQYFQSAFWPNFWADVFVAALFGIILNQFTDLLKTPKLSLVVKQDGFYRDTILLRADKNGKYVATVNFAIKNTGNKTIKTGEGYWNTYLDFKPKGKGFHYFVAGEPGHQRDLIRYSVYPNSFTDINDFQYDISINKEDLEKSHIPYMFQTDYGNFPRNIKWDLSTGGAPRDQFAFIKIELQK